MPSLIPDSHKDLLERPVVVTLVTLMPDGQPQATPVWCDFDGEYVRINTARGRQKDKNMQRQARVSILAIDPADPYRWMEIRGEVAEITEEGAAEHINALSRKYVQKDYYGGYRPAELRFKQQRVIYKIKPTRVNLE